MKIHPLDPQHYCLRLDKGEDIITALTDFINKEEVMSASFSGIGATNDCKIGLFDHETKQYHAMTLNEPLEILALTGNLTRQQGKPYVHAHITVSDHQGNAKGGHLNKAIISVTCEIFITIYQYELERRLDESIGINVIK